jgi:hypothetical protein
MKAPGARHAAAERAGGIESAKVKVTEGIEGTKSLFGNSHMRSSLS